MTDTEVIRGFIENCDCQSASVKAMSAVSAALDRQQAELDRLRAEREEWRKALWLAYNDGTAYGDDGEMQLWGIDFKRESLDQIIKAVVKRNVELHARLTAEQPAAKESSDV